MTHRFKFSSHFVISNPTTFLALTRRPTHFVLTTVLACAGVQSPTMNGMPGMSRFGLGAGGPAAAAGDAPQVDTAEQVYISSLALLKMLKHGASASNHRRSTALGT